MTDALTHTALVDSLWSARRQDRSVPAEPMSPDDGFAVLRQLVHRAVAAGDEIVGWKIARLPGDDGEPFFFAAPVFVSSFSPESRSELRDPRLEVELVARIQEVGAPGAAWQLDWHVGLEIVDNHDPGWPLHLGWAIADWGLHAAVVLGDGCRAPSDDEGFRVRVESGEGVLEADGMWRTGHATLTDVLARDCPRVGRACRPGDLVWSGALLPPMPVAQAPVHASVDGLGSATIHAS